MSRKFTPFSDDFVRRQLALLVPGTAVADYREAMRTLGRCIANLSLGLVPEIRDHQVCVLCTVEDADFLARGIVEQLEVNGLPHDRVRLACYWNERVRRFEGDDENTIDVAPIIKEYREVEDVQDSVLILAKSIIRGTCVVKTNLASLLDKQVPRRIVVAAPVMFNTAPEKLQRAFPRSISERFEYLAFAIDDEKDGHNNVLPGVGGSPYVRLGFEDHSKNLYVPSLVKERRQELFSQGRAS